MPAPTILKRNLEFHFPRAVSVSTQVPQTMEIVVIPLSDPSGPDQGTYVGGLQKQNVLLDDDDNVIVFQLVPTNSADLLAPVTYRVAWREGGVIGRTYTYDFAMPDADVRFDELQELGEIIGGETYLQQADLGVPGRVARLNEAGVPVDSQGHASASAAALGTLAAQIATEIANRTSADATTLANAQTYAVNQVNDLANQVAGDLDTVDTSLRQLITAEASARASAVTAEATARTAADTALGSSITAINTSLTLLDTDLNNKADLDETGRIPLGQIPPSAITNAVSVANETAMLALTAAQVQPGDLAVRPDGVYGLFGPDPSVLNNWVPLSKIVSVNGYQGVVNLTAADVGAVASGSELPISQITGLTTTLSEKADAADVTTLSSVVSSLQSDTTVVRTSGGLIPHTLLDANVAYVNANNEITLKDGTVIASGTGNVFSVNSKSGIVSLTAADVGAIALGTKLPITDITGLQTALDGKVGTTDPRLIDARTPTSHASSHTSGGSDPITINISQVTGLSTTLGGLTTAATTSDLTARISALETQVIELSGSGGGSPVSKDVWWNAATAISGVTTTAGLKTAGVKVRSPFGKASDNTYYYDPAGAAENEAVWPYITPNGHLELRKWDETAAADTVYATQTALDATNAAVSAKATQVDLNTLTTAVNAKASQTDLAALAATVDTKASTSALNSLSSTMATLATQATVNALAATVGTKANQTDLAALITQVATKATAADLSTARNDITALQSGQLLKADLVSVGTEKKVNLSQIPTNIPRTSIVGLDDILSSKANLVSGKLDPNLLPPISISNITNLETRLGTKANLVNGKLSTSELPAIATTTTTAVDTKAKMLALVPAPNIGDVCIIKSGTDQGTYTYVGPDPTLFTGWLLNVPPSLTNVVTSINGQVGTVTLNAGNVGARPAGALIPQADISGLPDKLSLLATTSALETGLTGRTTPDAVRTLISGSPQIKQVAKYVATTQIDNLYGTTAKIDGATLVDGDIVLVTAQASPITHGLYTVVANGPWNRTADLSTGSYFVRGSLVVVSSGALQANTVWQLTSTSGITGTDANNWKRILQAGPPIGYQSGNGLNMVNGVFSVNATTDPRYAGISVSADGVGIDTTRVPRKYVNFVQSGSRLCTVKHDLNTEWPIVQVFDASSGQAVLVGWTSTGPNTISMEFAETVNPQQWKVVVVG